MTSCTTMTLLCERTRKVERQSLFLPREQQICASQKSGKRLQVSKKKKTEQTGPSVDIQTFSSTLIQNLLVCRKLREQKFICSGWYNGIPSQVKSIATED